MNEIRVGGRIDLAGKVAFVSGASRGIGKAIAVALAEAGADLALTGRDNESLLRVAVNARQHGVQVWYKTAELADETAVQRLGQEALNEYGNVDILVNNAGLTFPQPIMKTGLKEWHTSLNVNALAPLLLTQAFGSGMIKRRRGKIVNVTSRAGLSALNGHAVYSASKAALHLLTQTMAVELGPHGIQANCIAPTVILTDMAQEVWGPGAHTDAKLARIPVGRFGLPTEVAELAVFLASPLSDFINGTIIPVDGGEGAW